ncbi:MAG: hypothetical protein HXY34_09030 [Candidatus Thorarchaeota archaeon]|nr:hypothetical protein [Candidatus Thorarchaeota archaeon]
MKRLWLHALSLVMMGLVILVAAVLSSTMVDLGLFALMMVPIGPTVPLAVGLTGLVGYMREGVIREDMLHTMGLVMSLGLTVAALPETAISIVYPLPDTAQFQFAVALLQVPVMLLWAIGVVGYVFIFNRVVPASRPKTTAAVLATILGLIIFTIKTLVSLFIPPPDAVLATICGFLALCLAVIVGSVTALLWHFRTGKMRIPLILMLFAMIILLSLNIGWCSSLVSPLHPMIRGLTAEAYLALGLSLTILSRIDEA